MIFKLIIDFLFTIGYKIVDLTFDFTPISISSDVLNFIIQIFTYANVLFPFNKLLPLAFVYGIWFQIRVFLMLVGFFKKYIPVI